MNQNMTMQKIDKESAHSTTLGMGTVIIQKAYSRDANSAIRAAEAEIARLEGLLSRFIPHSDVGRINSSAGISVEKVGCETYEIISRVLEFSKLSEGRFDITVGPLVDLWNNAKDRLTPPDESQIADVLTRVDYRTLVLNVHDRACGLIKVGQSIDLGSIGKGFAADRVMEIYRQHGVASAFINIGGNFAAIGAKPDGSPWRVGIQHPRNNNALVGTVSELNKSVVTYGDYQRFFIDKAGIRRHHILDPRIGYPAQSGLVSVTIVGENSMEADALSTMLFIAGMKKGVDILKAFPGIGAIYIDEDLRVYITQGLQDCFQITNDIRLSILDY